MTQVITPENPDKKTLLQNFFTVIRVYGAIWIIFHLTSVFFFGFIVGSPLLVGIFLGIGNIWSMIIDVPLGMIQRQIPAKRMLLVANILMFIATIIFLYLTRSSFDEALKFESGIIESTLAFLGTVSNVILLLTVGLLYGTIKEIYDITTMSYLLNQADPSEYDGVLAQNNVASGIGSVIGVLISIVILSLSTESVELILFFLMLLIVCVGVFIETYFDNSSETFDMEAVRNLHLIEKTKDVTQSAGAYVRTTLSTGDFQQIRQGLDYIIIKPKELTQSIDWGQMIENTKNEYKILYRLIFGKITSVPILLWTTGSIFIFGCWDTIVTTFFIDFMDTALQSSGVQNIIRSGFILIGLLAVPAYGLQMFWINQSTQYGKFNIIVLGLGISGIALFGLAFGGGIGELTGLIVVVFLGMMNSTGYAAGYPMSQSIFADEYNKSYAKASNSTIINADVSAAPLKILNNLANALGLIFGGLLISIAGFTGMFVVYGTAVGAWCVVSIIKKIQWNLE